MQIVEIVNTLEFGGLERLVVDLALSLQARGHQVKVICIRTTGPLATPLQENGIEVLPLGKSDGFSLPTLWKLTQHLRNNPVDVVHTHNPLVHHYGVMAARLAGVPAVVNTRHGLGNFPRIRKTEAVFELACQGTDRVVAVCRAAHDFFLKTTAIPHGKLTFISNGIPLEKFLSIHPAPERPGFTFGTVGRLVPVKNHRSLLHAFSLVAQRRPGCRLEILGDGPLRQELEALSCNLGIEPLVLFHGASLDVPAFLSRLDAFVLCSESEGLPLTLLEAMAAGLPVVATDVGGIPELVQDSGCGWLCPVSDRQRLADAMLRAAESGDRLEMGARGRASAVRSYSLEKMAENYELLFRDILASKGQAAA